MKHVRALTNLQKETQPRDMSSKIAFIKHRHMKHHQKFVHDYYYILNGEMMMLKKHN